MRFIAADSLFISYSAEVEDAVHQKPSMAGSSKTVPQ